MQLEKEIKQSAFNNEYQKLAVNILYTFFWMKEQNSQLLKPFGVTMQQYNVLRILRGQHPKGITTSDIRSRMLDKMSDTSRLVDRLTKRNLVEKRVNPSDRRLVEVRITDSGLDLLEKIGMDRDATSSFAKNISEEQARQMNEWLDLMRD